MKIWPRMLALVLPIAALGTSWVFTHFKAQQGTIWTVPISGYDPRDLLRGHYINYRYDWPGLIMSDERRYIQALCISGVAPTIDATILHDDVAAQNPQATSECKAIARTAPGSASNTGLSTGKIYIAQTKAAALEHQLVDPKLRTYIHIRIRDDGIVTPIELEFRPRSVVLSR